MAQLIEIWWGDIPAQVIVKRSGKRSGKKSGSEQYKYVLPERFEKAIDRMAMRGRHMDADAYLAGFYKTAPVTVEGDDLQHIATQRGKALETAYTDARLEQIIKSVKK